MAVNVDKDYKDAHEQLITAANLTIQALTEIVSAIDNSDFSKLTSANKLMADGSLAERKYLQMLEDKSKELGLDIADIAQ